MSIHDLACGWCERDRFWTICNRDKLTLGIHHYWNATVILHSTVFRDWQIWMNRSFCTYSFLVIAGKLELTTVLFYERFIVLWHIHDNKSHSVCKCAIFCSYINNRYLVLYSNHLLQHRNLLAGEWNHIYSHSFHSEILMICLPMFPPFIMEQNASPIFSMPFVTVSSAFICPDLSHRLSSQRAASSLFM